MGFFSKLKQVFEFSFNVVEDAPALTPGQERGLALGAPYAAEGNLPINALTMQTDPATAAKLLASAWGVTSPADVADTYAGLLGRGHRAYYEFVRNRPAPAMSGFATPSRMREYKQYGEQLAADAAASDLDPARVSEYATAYLTMQAMWPAGLPASIAAWDAARVVHVSRLMRDAGFVSDDDAWAAIDAAVALAKSHHHSWKEFADAFIVGRVFWSGGQDSSQDSFESANKHLLERPDSPWTRLPW